MATRTVKWFETVRPAAVGLPDSEAPDRPRLWGQQA
jgi:hypothetical protein